MRSILRSIMAVVIGVLAVSFPCSAAAEDSPRASSVVHSSVPRECLDNGSFKTEDGVTYTCVPYATEDVYNTREERAYGKTVYRASKQAAKTDPPIVQLGLVVKQDEMKKIPRTDTEPVLRVAVVNEKNVPPVKPELRFKYASPK